MKSQVKIIMYTVLIVSAAHCVPLKTMENQDISGRIRYDTLQHCFQHTGCDYNRPEQPLRDDEFLDVPDTWLGIQANKDYRKLATTPKVGNSQIITDALRHNGDSSIRTVAFSIGHEWTPGPPSVRDDPMVAVMLMAEKAKNRH